MQYSLKLIDTLLQSFVLVGGITVLLVFGFTGYFYWAVIGLCLWLPLSSLIHVLFKFNIEIGRWVVWGGYALTVFSLLVFHWQGATLPQLNFYLYPLALLKVGIYWVLSLYELSQLRKVSKEDIDF
jgi:hypothetical protein